MGDKTGKGEAKKTWLFKTIFIIFEGFRERSRRILVDFVQNFIYIGRD